MKEPLYRIIDANFNRAREALRVMEDYARFALNNSELSEKTKILRHQLCQYITQIPAAELLTARDTPGDVGTAISTESEKSRPDMQAVTTAAAKRLTEALRCLEEFTKIQSPKISSQLEALRYQAYELEKRLLIPVKPDFKNVRIYVLLTAQYCTLGLLETARAVLDGGADCIQLREKDLPDKQTLNLAQQLTDICNEYQALFIMNDRPDLALLAHAHGVHLGQDDLAPHQARKILTPYQIIGTSTHSLEEATQSITQNPDYIAVGAIYPSPTKPKVPACGLSLITQIRQITQSPIIAIGGITESNAPALIQAGATGIALCQAVTATENPKKSVQNIKNSLR